MAARSAWMIWSSLALVAGRGLLDLTRFPRTFQRFSMKLTARVDFESSENVTLLQYWRAQAGRRVLLMAYRTRQNGRSSRSQAAFAKPPPQNAAVDVSTCFEPQWTPQGHSSRGSVPLSAHTEMAVLLPCCCLRPTDWAPFLG